MEVELMTVRVSQLRPNPFRRLAEYPIIPAKVEALRSSIEATGFWSNIIARPCGDNFEIAFGHHRLFVLVKMDPDQWVKVLVRDVSNEDMLRMMASENLQEWGHSVWVEVETVRAVVEAYGKGEIELPEVPAKTAIGLIRYASPDGVGRAYTRGTVAQFLGWTRRATGEGSVQPNSGCGTAFQILDAITANLVTADETRSLSRTQARDLIAQRKELAEEAELAAALKEQEEKEDQEELARQQEQAGLQVFVEPVQEQEQDQESQEPVQEQEEQQEEAGDASGAIVWDDSTEYKDEEYYSETWVDDLAYVMVGKLGDFANEIVKDVTTIGAHQNELSSDIVKLLREAIIDLIQVLDKTQGPDFTFLDKNIPDL